MAVLLTGGTGYIGSHVAVALIAAGYDIVIADNFSNSDISAMDGIYRITGIKPKMYEANVSSRREMEPVFLENHVEAVIHLAGYKAVGESVQKPVIYYQNNIDSLLSVLEIMERFDCKRIVFSSSATVYGMGNKSPLTEDMPTGNCANPYGWTKHFIEQILRDTVSANPDISAISLRYFNPVGAHSSGWIGEKPNGMPNNLMPRITQAAIGSGPPLEIFGGDYPTADGTGIRDYIHVMDLAEGHVAALRYGETHAGWEVFNLGTGTGVSVLHLVETFQSVNGVTVPYTITSRREGDLAVCYADAGKAESILGWRAKRTVKDMCRDAWRWEKNINRENQTHTHITGKELPREWNFSETSQPEQETQYEICVVCGSVTSVPVSLAIKERKTYMPTVGQLCEKCCEKLYHTRDLRTIPSLWDEFQ